MSQNQSKQPSVAELLEMSRTQIVAEAFLLDEDIRLKKSLLIPKY